MRSLIRFLALVIVLVTCVPVLAQNVGSGSGAGGTPLTVKENDNVPTVPNINSISFTNGTVVDDGGGAVSVTISGTGAPTDATYITQTANGTLSAEQALGVLPTGCMASSTTTGVVATRIITGTANEITVTNGNCSGNPTLSIPTNPTLPGTTTGTFSGPLTGAVTGNASTATALAADPTDCVAGEGTRGINASGTAQNCTNFTEEPGSNGLVARTAANTAAARTFTGTANQITIADGDGVAANPTASLSSTLTIPGPGIEFTETAGDATCAAGNYWIKANSTTTNFRKCQNGTATDLDTGGAGGIGGSTGATDNAIIRADGTGGTTIQSSGCTISDTNLLTCPGGFSSSGGTGYFTITEGTAPGSPSGAGEHNLYVDSGDSKLKSHENGGSVVTYARTADPIDIFASSTSTQLATLLSDEIGTSGGFVRGTGSTLTNLTIAGTAIVLPDGVTQTFNPNGTNAGLNVGSQAGLVSTPNNGDIWYDSTGNKYKCRENGVTVDCISTGAGSGDITDVAAGAGIAVATPGGPAPTVSWDAATFVNNVTLWDSANASRTLTAGLSGATDPVITFSNSTINVSTGTLQEGGVAVSLPARTEVLTNKTIDAAATGNSITIKQEYVGEMAGCNNATAGPVYNLPTTAAATATCDTGSNQFSAYLSFADAANESTHGSFLLPTGYGGGIDWTFRYKMASATSGAIGWCVQLVRLATGAAGDPAFPALASGNCVSDTVPGTAGFEDVATITGVTCTSCVAGDRVFFRVSRDGGGTAVTDSATGAGRLILSGRSYAVTY